METLINPTAITIEQWRSRTSLTTERERGGGGEGGRMVDVAGDEMRHLLACPCLCVFVCLLVRSLVQLS